MLFEFVIPIDLLSDQYLDRDYSLRSGMLFLSHMSLRVPQGRDNLLPLCHCEIRRGEAISSTKRLLPIGLQ